MSAQPDGKPKRKYNRTAPWIVSSGVDRKGTRAYTEAERSRIIMIWDFFEGNVARTSQVTGVDRGTIRKYLKQGGFDENYKFENTTGQLADTLTSLRRLINTLSVIMINHAHKTDIAGAAKAMATAAELLKGFEAQEHKHFMERKKESDARKGPRGPASVHSEHLKIIPTLEEVVNDERRRENVEELIMQVMTDAANEGNPITEEEAARILAENNPELKDLIFGENVN